MSQDESKEFEIIATFEEDGWVRIQKGKKGVPYTGRSVVTIFRRREEYDEIIKTEEGKQSLLDEIEKQELKVDGQNLI